MKQYILDRHTTPGTPVMDQVPTEKIPVYDTAADAEADFANIADDQIYFTKEDKFDVDDMKDYIRKQNVLSDWESITISTDSNNPTEMQYDGFITAKVAKDNGATDYIYINGTAFSLGASNAAIHYRFTLPVNKGDEVYYVSTYPLGDIFGTFYKLRDYSDR